MAQFINKLIKDFSNTLKLSCEEKPNYYAKIFEETLWYPKLKGVSLSSRAAQLKTQVQQKETPASVAANKVEVIRDTVVLNDDSSNISNGDKVKISTTFDNFIKQYNSDWKIDTIPGYKDYQGEIDIIFFGLDEIEENEIPDFLPLSMIESSQDIMGRMIKAMKIPSGRFIRIPYIKKNAREFIYSCCAHFKPKLLICLGASATNLCLNKKVRLAKVHGVFNDIQVEVEGKAQVIEVMPLFHPKLLEVNESMKKTAWADMQKAIAKISS